MDMAVVLTAAAVVFVCRYGTAVGHGHGMWRYERGNRATNICR